MSIIKKGSISFVVFLFFCTIWPVFAKEVRMDVPYLKSGDLVSGCESVSASMLLRFWNIDVSPAEFYDNFLTKKNWERKNGAMYAADPDAAYVGNARIKNGLNCGFGCYPPVLVKTIERLISIKGRDDIKVINTTGKDLSTLCSDYLDKGIPVIIYATMNMCPVRDGAKWIVDFVDEENSHYKIGDRFTWKAGEHCLVLTGYDDEHYFLNDPYMDKGKVSVRKDMVDPRFVEMGKRSVVIIKKEEHGDDCEATLKKDEIESRVVDVDVESLVVNKKEILDIN